MFADNQLNFSEFAGFRKLKQIKTKMSTIFVVFLSFFFSPRRA
jgi:hypothetical protein